MRARRRREPPRIVDDALDAEARRHAHVARARERHLERDVAVRDGLHAPAARPVRAREHRDISRRHDREGDASFGVGRRVGHPPDEPRPSHRLPRTIGVPASAVPDDYTLALWLPDAATSIRDRAEYAIRFVNQGTWGATSGYNLLTSTLSIATSAAPNGTTPDATFGL